MLAWLAEAAKAKAWTPVEATGHQLSLFGDGKVVPLKAPHDQYMVFQNAPCIRHLVLFVTPYCERLVPYERSNNP